MELSITVNGTTRRDDVEPRLLLAQYLRDVVGLTGTNIGCDTTSCGACTVLLDGESVKACTVLLDGRSVKSCTVLAVQADEHEVTTIEGLATNGELHPLQRAFHEHHALQCGYCTPGMIMAAVGLIEENGELSDEEIRRGLEGNLCRCTGYHNIVTAIQSAAQELRSTPATAREEAVT